MTPSAFIAHWSASSAAERANYQMFLLDLCELIGVARPNPATDDAASGDYRFERPIQVPTADGQRTTTNFIDLYKRGCFILEAKQGGGGTQSDPGSTDSQLAASLAGMRSGKSRRVAPKTRSGTAKRGTAAWDNAMLDARYQAEHYAKHLPDEDGWPPFIIVVDVGHAIELFADFSGTGKHYAHFPDAKTYRFRLVDLERQDIRDRLLTIWTAPATLNPALYAAGVTRQAADALALVAKGLEESGHDPRQVAEFLTRCLFCFFSEDTGLLPRDSFTRILSDIHASGDLSGFKHYVGTFWIEMDKGGPSSTLRSKIHQFNGSFFANPTVLPVTKLQLEALIAAAKLDWAAVEPSIIGTLLERALDPVERHKLGAHYTPRAYVERLVFPTIIDPLREEFRAIMADAIANPDKPEKAIKALERFGAHLASIRVLDPACGSGNFLYVAYEHLKRLEGEVREAMRQMDPQQREFLEIATVSPKQFLGIEINPRAASLAELVLWIGHYQWLFRNATEAVHEPILENHHNIENRDAVLAYDACKPVLDKAGNPVTRWDGRSTKQHPTTGLEVPDESCTVPDLRYIKPRQASWPDAEYIIGNPPFLGTARMRQALGDGYVDAIRSTITQVPESADFVMYWWDHAAELARHGRIIRFGFVTTNSLRQTFARRVLERHMQDPDNPLCLRFAIPDHPWVDSADGAAVRIAMTVGQAGKEEGVLAQVTRETSTVQGHADVVIETTTGRIHSNLTLGADITLADPLHANEGLSCPGVKLHGDGFIVTREEARALGLGKVNGLERHISEYRNGKDLTQRSRDVMVIDLFGLEAEIVRNRFPAVYQWVYERVKPERDLNNRASYRDNWWIHGEPRRAFRPALVGIGRYIATTETAKHRVFQFLDAGILPDNMLVCVASEDAFILGVLSSRIHVAWALAQGGTLEDRPRYNKTRCFETFPFPAATAAQRKRIGDIAERLDAHRKRQLEEHPKLTLTGMYNVLDLLRAGTPLSAKEKTINEQGLVGVLRELHDELDASVAAAYGWPADLPDDAILARLLELNRYRAEEEASGKIRWLRPDFQAKRA